MQAVVLVGDIHEAAPVDEDILALGDERLGQHAEPGLGIVRDVVGDLDRAHRVREVTDYAREHDARKRGGAATAPL